MFQAVWDALVYGIKRFQKPIVVALLFWMVFLTPATAQAPTRGGEESCAIQYQRFAIQAFDRFNQGCILGMNHLPWYQRWGRLVCHAEYFSDAIQGVSEYASCMSFDTWFNR